LRADGVIVRAQPVIRADGFRPRKFEGNSSMYSPMSANNHCALRAPTVFLVRIKNIRTKNTVMD
jgi:hypothetical protein